MAGIDYGMGRTNIDPVTRIRYGVISQHSMADWFYDEFNPEYGDAHCPKCGNKARDVTDESVCTCPQMWNGHEEPRADPTRVDSECPIHGAKYDHESGCTDYACDDCRITFDSSEAFPEEPIGFQLETDGYRAIDCLDSDVMLVASPFYTYAPYCSPCVPGAGNLDNASTHTEPLQQEWPKAYCFGHDWFNGGRAPYRVFRVSDDTEVFPEEQTK